MVYMCMKIRSLRNQLEKEKGNTAQAKMLESAKDDEAQMYFDLYEDLL